MDSRLWQDPNGVRRFTSQAIQDAVDRALVGVEGKALSGDIDIDGNGVRGVVAFKEPGGWSIGLIGEIDSKKDWGVGFRVKKVWK